MVAARSGDTYSVLLITHGGKGWFARGTPNLIIYAYNENELTHHDRRTPESPRTKNPMRTSMDAHTHAPGHACCRLQHAYTSAFKRLACSCSSKGFLSDLGSSTSAIDSVAGKQQVGGSSVITNSRFISKYTMFESILPFPPETAAAVDEYCRCHSTDIHPMFAEQEAWTIDNFDTSQMMSGALQAQFYVFFARDRQARRVLEIGTFTGYSALAWKEGMKSISGEVWTCEASPRSIKACKAAFRKYDPEGKIHLLEGLAIQT
ncbi:MAG: hypothetical protein Q9191_004246 [Dirinaria sp. TL-2023a]